MLATQDSMQNSLRWLRRLIVIIFIIANLMTVILADAASAAQNSPPSLPKAWVQQGFNPFTNYNPSTGSYDTQQAMDPGEAIINNTAARLASREPGANMPQLIIASR